MAANNATTLAYAHSIASTSAVVNESTSAVAALAYDTYANDDDVGSGGSGGSGGGGGEPLAARSCAQWNEMFANLNHYFRDQDVLADSEHSSVQVSGGGGDD